MTDIIHAILIYLVIALMAWGVWYAISKGGDRG